MAKEFFINSVELIDVSSSTNIPTVLLYRPSRSPVIGSEAFSQAGDRDEINEDFKVDLGNQKPGSGIVRRFYCADEKMRSAADLTSDFIHELIVRVSSWLDARDIKQGPNVLVAEPLAMQEGLVSESWLANYRAYIRRILSGKGFANVDFLPEPFAVYQFYRYGQKHPLVAERRKHHALVIDFGGGTFDVCLIETTKEGDISQSGRMAKPLSASSNPIGGFFINRIIAEDLIRKAPGVKHVGAKLHKALDFYRRWRKEGLDLNALSPDYKNFIRHYHRLSYRVEDAKLTLCRLIPNWSLDAPTNLSVPIAVPQDPFSDVTSAVNLQYSAAELRAAFISKVWESQLRQIIRLTLQRGKEELTGAPATVVLLSGGSANIKWLVELLRRDFASELQDAEILLMKDFQEVVAKGLAVECARRYYTAEHEGDFSTVTYNRLCLILDPDETGHALKKFHPRDSALPSTPAAGVLLPSASVLTRFKDRAMRWRVHLDSAPRRSLSYFFLRSSFDPADVQNLQNLEERVVHTPKNCKFDPDLTVELRVTDDSTAIPRFIYKLGRSEEENISQQGRAFFLDMTTGEAGTTCDISNAFIGLDFGTSNTSVSFVTTASIQQFERRSHERSWNELSDLSSSLPYPLAASLASYLCQTDAARLAAAAREFLESALTLAVYTAYQEFCSTKGRAETRKLKALSKRSAGPLWAMFQDIMAALGKQASVSAGLRELLEPELYKEMDSAVNIVAQHKHGKATEDTANILRPVQILANVSHKVFGVDTFGMFQHVEKQRFGSSYQGTFRHAHGRPPFIGVSQYSGDIAFSHNETFVRDRRAGTALPLEPLVLWEHCKNHPDLENGHCYLFDAAERNGTFTFKAVAYPCTLTISKGDRYTVLAERLSTLMEKDSQLTPVTVKLSAAEVA
jgi:hypothetical protein